MAALTQKFHVKQNNIVYECTCYTTEEEATPITVDRGSCMPVVIDGQQAYVGLWPKKASGGLYHTPLSALKDGIEYWVETQVVNVVPVTITQQENQTIQLIIDGVTYTTSGNVPANKEYYIEVVPDYGYVAGNLCVESTGTTKLPFSISALAPSRQKFTVSIEQDEGQTITVTCNGKSYTDDFTAYYLDTWTATITADEGSVIGSLYPGNSGTVDGPMTIMCRLPGIAYNTFIIPATTRQTITATIKVGNVTRIKTSSSSAQTFYVPSIATWTATVAADTGWKAGVLADSSGDCTTNITLSVTAATHITYTLKLGAATNQTITLKYKNYNGSSYASEVTKTSTSSTQSFTVGYGTTWTATVAGTTYYKAGTLSASSGTVKAATTVSVTAATHITYKITLTQKTNETVTIHYKNHNGSALASSWSTTTATVTLGKGSKYYSTIAASTGYTAGTITSPGTSSSPNTLTAAKTIAFTAATAKKYTLYTDSSTDDGQWINGTYRGENWSGTFAYGTKITYKTDRAWTNYKISVYKGKNSNGTLWMTKTTREFSFNMPASNVFVQDNCIDVSSSCSCSSCSG